MVKRLITFALVGLLFSFQFQLRSEALSAQMIDFESYLEPQERVLLNQNEPMVYIPLDFIEVIKTIPSEVQEVKDLIDHIKMGYTIAPLKDISIVVQQALKDFDSKSSHYAIVKNYQQALLNGAALVRTEQMGNRRNKLGKFCALFVEKCASIGCLNVRDNTLISRDLTVDGNIIFNNAGTNVLNAQGAVETKSRLVRGTVLLTPTGTVTLTSPGGVDTPVTLDGSLPIASAVSGSGFSVATATALGFSSGIISTTSIGSEFYFVLGFQIPITFPTVYSDLPTIVATVQSSTTLIGSALLAGLNSTAAVEVQITNLTTGGAMLNLQFHITAQSAGGSTPIQYTGALGIAQIILNNLLGKSLSINFFSDGPVA